MEFNKGYGSSTHQPMIKAVMDLYKPKFVLELGIGMYSTPLLRQTSYMGIENNSAWIEYMGFPDVIHHDIGNIKEGTHWDGLTTTQIAKLGLYYERLNFIDYLDLRPNLLFVDNYASCRVLAINILRDNFDLIIFHDCEPNAVSWYRWDLLNKGNFKLFYLTSYESWTGLMVKNDSAYDALQNALMPHIEEYEREMGDVNMKLINDDNHI